MTNWYKKTVLFITIMGGVLGKQLPTIATQEPQIKLRFDSDYSLENYYLNEHNLLAQKNIDCQKIKTKYKEVYSFETESYYINICQLGNRFYYHRESKVDPDNALLIPAQVVFGGDVFQASSGKTTYFVGKDGDRYYSSVMQNDNEIVFEPELQIPSSVLATNNTLSEFNYSTRDMMQNNTNPNVSLELDNPYDITTEESLICTREKSAFHPHLDGWQKLIGKSPDTANKYATNQGHNFIYDNSNPNQALIKTKEGEIINLNITTVNETIDRVCIQPKAGK